MRELIIGFAPPELAQHARLDALERVNASFVSKQMQRREGDIIWRVPLHAGTDLYLYLLLEFQSRIDRAMPVRMLQYVAALYDHLLREKQALQKPGCRPCCPWCSTMAMPAGRQPVPSSR